MSGSEEGDAIGTHSALIRGEILVAAAKMSKAAHVATAVALFLPQATQLVV